ncbi:MAG: hypothetical protein ACRBBJ_00975 [Rhodomicrobiaceae bacterium]
MFRFYHLTRGAFPGLNFASLNFTSLKSVDLRPLALLSELSLSLHHIKSALNEDLFGFSKRGFINQGLHLRDATLVSLLRSDRSPSNNSS